LLEKSLEFEAVIKIGRTHLMDATPVTLGQEFSGYHSQIDHGLQSLNNSLSHLSELALGATAVGTGINSPKNYDTLSAEYISKFTGIEFISAKNKFESIASHDALVETHVALKLIANSLNKIANDIRLMASGPRSGIGEIITSLESRVVGGAGAQVLEPRRRRVTGWTPAARNCRLRTGQKCDGSTFWLLGLPCWLICTFAACCMD
jgi:fumarate hydratase class II